MSEPIRPTNYRVADRDLRYFIFDWDDNILHMSTKIYMERRAPDGSWTPHPVSTAVFSVIRADTENYRPENGDWEFACRDFRDIQEEDENIFLRHTRLAIDRVVNGEEPEAPSFVRFRTTLIEGRLFAIVTARGHAPAMIREGVEYFIQTVLTQDERSEMLRNLRGYVACFDPNGARESDEELVDYYLGNCRYHGVCSPEFLELLREHGQDMSRTEEGKQFAIRDFVNHVIRIARERGLSRPISVGFSDDDPGNAEAVEEYIREELGREFPSIRFVVYYTADPDIPSGRKVEVHGQLNLPGIASNQSPV